MAQRFDLTGKIAVVAGGAGGIGQAVVAGLEACGASVWVWDLTLPFSPAQPSKGRVQAT